MAQGGLIYSVDSVGDRKISIAELQSFYGVTVDQTLTNSQMRISNENDIENKLEVLIEISKAQLAATIENNKLLKRNNEIMESQLRLEHKPEPKPEKKQKSEPRYPDEQKPKSYLDGLGFGDR